MCTCFSLCKIWKNLPVPATWPAVTGPIYIISSLLATHDSLTLLEGKYGIKGVIMPIMFVTFNANWMQKKEQNYVTVRRRMLEVF